MAMIAETPEFSAAVLRDSIIFDSARELKGESSDFLLSRLEEHLRESERRKRALRESDALARRRTLSIFLANLAASAYNQVKPHRFIAMSFGRSSYSPDRDYSRLSFASVTLARDAFHAAGWIEVAKGFNRFDYLNERFGMLTRLRATPAFIDLLYEYDVRWTSIHVTNREPIKLRDPTGDVGAEPVDVQASRLVIGALNNRLSDADILLPQECWDDLKGRRREVEEDRREAWLYDGDLPAKSLYRTFSGNWNQGGRLYGGWWQNVPSNMRAAITIDGSRVCELDYGQLHPRILYARLGRVPSADPYIMSGFDRSLNKETFMRLLNGNTTDIRKPRICMPPTGTSFQLYLSAYLDKLRDISPWFGKGEGLRLQREDSDLAIDVIRRLNTEGIMSLPVHDSFIVKQEHRPHLYRAMWDCFVERYRVGPEIR